MNGIIHNCSHPNDNDVNFRITEDQIFLAIFNYIDHLFAKIKPKKLFFLAVDGVAPRAKMNQQRARRFRTARDNEEARKKAIKEGQELPKEPPFDSNCITPGTPFMARLQEQLKYFINKKITEDASWRGIEVILSGHEVPGEGEHKIMEYLRLAKSQPDYSPNLRHCLYGLDADLMMLGLLSHEPHFALLREEVTFGKTRKKSGANPESQNFYLMHLSLFREYLDLEFSPLKQTLPFTYDLERIIDDFIFMSFFVGNDFLPNLPGLHINEGALAFMFRTYKKVIPSAGGYLNDGGELNLERCEMLLKEISGTERELFEVERGDMMWVKGKRDPTGERVAIEQARKGLVMSKRQREIYDQIKTFVLAPREEGSRLTFSTLDMPARDRKFILTLSNNLGISHTIDILPASSSDPSSRSPSPHTKQHHIVLEWDENDDESDEESFEARKRVLKKYDSAKVEDEEEVAKNLKEEEERKVEEAFVEWKAEYYKEKLEFDYGNKEALGKLVFSYVEGLQWVLKYYYEGVASWEWFYPYHYAPKITGG
ncbi:5'-3' exoribonuclease 1, partial [Rhizophlyctis rosea]